MRRFSGYFWERIAPTRSLEGAAAAVTRSSYREIQGSTPRDVQERMRLACVAAVLLVAGCGKQSASSDAASSTSASPVGVKGRPGFTVEIPGASRNDAVVVRIDEAKVPPFE